MTAHICHAHRCDTPVPPRMLMCRRHWRMVPRRIQKLVLAYYVPGQEVRKDPTAAYVVVQRLAVLAVASKEGHPGTDLTALLVTVTEAWAAVPPAEQLEILSERFRVPTVGEENR